MNKILRALKALGAALLLAAFGSSALAQSACYPSTPRTDTGAGFTAFGANEQVLARGGNTQGFHLSRCSDLRGHFFHSSLLHAQSCQKALLPDRLRFGEAYEMPTLRTINVLEIVLGLVCLFIAFSPRAQEPPATVPESLMKSIGAIARGAAPVIPAQVDPVACAPVGQSPGIVRVDLNGDGHDDYAVLVRTGETGKQKDWEGRKLRETRFAFVLFLANAAGTYRTQVVRRYTDFMPTTVVLDLQPAGPVRHRETHKQVMLKNPGVTLSFCEKSAATYFVVGQSVRLVPIAD